MAKRKASKISEAIRRAAEQGDFHESKRLMLKSNLAQQKRMQEFVSDLRVTAKRKDAKGEFGRFIANKLENMLSMLAAFQRHHSQLEAWDPDGGLPCPVPEVNLDG